MQGIKQETCRIDKKGNVEAGPVLSIAIEQQQRDPRKKDTDDQLGCCHIVVFINSHQVIVGLDKQSMLVSPLKSRQYIKGGRPLTQEYPKMSESTYFIVEIKKLEQ